MADRARKRRGAFKADELDILLEEVEANKGLLFDSFKGASTNKQKTKKWGQIAERMTAVTGTYRSEVEVRKKWRDFVHLTKKKASDLRHQTALSGSGLTKLQPLSGEEQRAMAIIGCSAPPGVLGGAPDVHAGLQEPSGEQRRGAEEAKPQGSTAAAAAPTSQPTLTTQTTPPSTSATRPTPSSAPAHASCRCSQELVELEREKVGLLQDVCGLLREAAERDKNFQDEVLALKRAKFEMAASQLAYEEEKFGQQTFSHSPRATK